MKRKIITYARWDRKWRNLKTYKNHEIRLQADLQLVQSPKLHWLPIRGACFKGKNNRVVERNHNLEHYKQKARENLLSEIGEIKRKKRTADVEPVFAHNKSNRNFKRFTHRGLNKVELEFGLPALPHNIKKKSA